MSRETPNHMGDGGDHLYIGGEIPTEREHPEEPDLSLENLETMKTEAERNLQLLDKGSIQYTLAQHQIEYYESLIDSLKRKNR